MRFFNLVRVVSPVACLACALSATSDSAAAGAGHVAPPSRVGSCTEGAILTSAPGSAHDFMARAFAWIHEGVWYREGVTSQSAPYRADCSGFVSYVWGLPPPGDTTYSLADGPWDNRQSVPLPSWNDLTIGDAVNFPGDPSSGVGHVMLFAGWLDDAHTQFCALEESMPGTTAHVSQHSLSEGGSGWGGGGTLGSIFLPIRKAGYSPHLTIASPARPKPPFVGMARTRDGAGYWEAKGDGDVLVHGDARMLGSMHGHRLNAPLVGMAPTTTGRGYWLAAADGGVFTFGDAAFSGSAGDRHLNQPVVGVAANPEGHGYWLVAADGGVFSFGGAAFHGSLGGKLIDAPVVGMAATPTGRGYWLVAADGGVFSFGDASFHGSAAGHRLNAPVVGMAATPDGRGYWLTAADGGVFSFGDARFYGSLGGKRLDAPVVGIVATPNGRGYWLVGGDGGVFSFGDAGFHGSSAHASIASPLDASWMFASGDENASPGSPSFAGLAFAW